MVQNYTLCIDLGTTNSVVAVWHRGAPRPLPIEGTATPHMLRSCVLVDPEKGILVGQDALNRRVLYPDHFFSSIKTYMGTEHTYTVGDQIFTPVSFSAEILKHLIGRARRVLEAEAPDGVNIRNLIVTIPARFTMNARRATQEACAIAGYPAGEWSEPGTHELVLESDAAVMAYLNLVPANGKVVVFDLGGGTFDVTAMQFDPSASVPFRHLAEAGGDPRLGGDVFDDLLFHQMLTFLNHNEDETDGTVQRTFPAVLDLTQPCPPDADQREWARAIFRLRDFAREFKERLFAAGSAEDYALEEYLPELYDGRTPEKPFTLTRRAFDAQIRSYLERAVTETTRIVNRAGLVPEDIDRVVLAGGSTKIPVIGRMLVDAGYPTPNAQLAPDRAIAEGAVVWGELRQRLVGVMPKPMLSMPIGIKLTVDVKEAIVGPIARTVRKERFHEVIAAGTPFGEKRSVTVTTTGVRQRRMQFEVYQPNGRPGDDACARDDLVGWFSFTVPDAQRRVRPAVSLEIGTDATGSKIEVRVTDIEKNTTVEHDFALKAPVPVDAPPSATRSGQADIVIAMDTTGSMQRHIRAMAENAKALADQVRDAGVDARFAIIDYKDCWEDENPLHFHAFTTNIDEVKTILDAMEADGGGDEPESAACALAKALSLGYRPSVQRVVILITDASSHPKTCSVHGELISGDGLNVKAGEECAIGVVGRELDRLGFTLYVISIARTRDQYSSIIPTNGGKFLEMSRSRSFTEIIDEIAKDIGEIALFGDETGRDTAVGDGRC